MSTPIPNKTTINGVDIIDEGDVIHFVPSEDCNESKKSSSDNTKKNDNVSWFGKIVNWFKSSKIKPYVKVRDLADPFGDRTDCDAGSDGKSGVEAGIKISF